MSRVVTSQDSDAGWWPPGHGEPGHNWDYESTTLALIYENGDNIEILQVTPAGDRALASVPVEAIAEVLARARTEP